MIDLGLQRISRLMAETAMPWRAIHVAGTNGKGSVCAYISEMLNVWNKSELREEKAKPVLSHGRFTSPHLVDPWDCIAFNNTRHEMTPIDPRQFYRIMSEVTERNRKQAIGATDFELLTATAFEAFSRAKVDVAVVEVGMGGRLDSTNIIGLPIYNANGTENTTDRATWRPAPLVTVVNKIGLDHQGFLGDTIADIAFEKAGIIKPGVPIVCDGSNVKEVRTLIMDVAKENSAPLSEVDELSTPVWTSDTMWKPDHQRQNFGVAREATQEALKRVTDLFDLDLKHGDFFKQSTPAEKFAYSVSATINTKFSGRQETIDLAPIAGLKNPRHALLDGAHNVQSAQALADRLASKPRFEREDEFIKPTAWIVAASDSKDITGILKELIHAKSGDSVYAVEFGGVEGMPWVKAMESAKIAELANKVSSSVEDYNKDIRGALKAAALTDRNIIITGSLYLVGDVHRILRDPSGEPVES